MKKIISIFFLNLAIISAFFLAACSGSSENIPKNAVKLVALKSEKRYSDSITMTKDITLKCSVNYQIGVDNKTGDFVFCLKNKESPLKTIVLSCDKKIAETDYYSYENLLIFKNLKTESEWIEIDEKYCNQECSYAIIFIEDNKELFYAKFIRK